MTLSLSLSLNPDVVGCIGGLCARVSRPPRPSSTNLLRPCVSALLSSVISVYCSQRTGNYHLIPSPLSHVEGNCPCALSLISHVIWLRIIGEKDYGRINRADSGSIGTMPCGPYRVCGASVSVYFQPDVKGFEI